MTVISCFAAEVSHCWTLCWWCVWSRTGTVGSAPMDWRLGFVSLRVALRYHRKYSDQSGGYYQISTCCNSLLRSCL